MHDVIPHPLDTFARFFNEKLLRRTTIVELTKIDFPNAERPRTMNVDRVLVNYQEGRVRLLLLAESQGLRHRGMMFEWFPSELVFREVFPLTHVGNGKYADTFGSDRYLIRPQSTT